MPRRRNLGGSRRRRNFNPPKPIVVKARKVDYSGLELAYDWAKAELVFGLQLAFAWYDREIPLLLAKSPLDADGQKTFDRAGKARKLSEGTNMVEEQKHAASTALRLYEKLFLTQNPQLPKVDDALVSDAKPSRVVAQQQVLLESLQVFEVFNVRYQLTAGRERTTTEAPSESSPTPVSVVSLPVLELLSYRGTILGFLLREAVEVAKQQSIVQDDEGNWKLSASSFFNLLPQVLERVSMADGVRGAVAAVLGGKVKAVRTNVSASARMPRTKFQPTQTIHIMKTGKNPFHGSRGVRFDLIKDGATISAYHQTMMDAGVKNVNFFILEQAVALGFVEVV